MTSPRPTPAPAALSPRSGKPAPMKPRDLEAGDLGPAAPLGPPRSATTLAQADELLRVMAESAGLVGALSSLGGAGKACYYPCRHPQEVGLKRFIKGMGYAIGVLVLHPRVADQLRGCGLAQGEARRPDAEDRGHAHPPGPRPVPGQPRGRLHGLPQPARLEGLRAPLHPRHLGKGGDPIFSQAIGLPGVIQPKNSLPTASSATATGELVRVIRQRRHQGRESPSSPSCLTRPSPRMEQEDLYSIVAYLRTLARDQE